MIKNRLLAIAGVISTILGIVFVIPNSLSENYWLAIGASILVVGGIILLAISFGD